ncbi:MAG: hypothetical protein ACK5V5_06010 [Cyclobacteriaceae bacterium]|jgi:PBP1b-binding outer membrane lipoprotein LpoB|nr:hypothetical protein [Flammeovirgaceae bacterium]
MTLKFCRLSIILALAVLLAACQSTHHSGTRKQKKNYKPGKPIPCPIKDC